jgi:hypothetical protein
VLNPTADLRIDISSQLAERLATSVSSKLSADYTVDKQTWIALPSTSRRLVIPIRFNGRAATGTPGRAIISFERLETDQLLGARKVKYSWLVDLPVGNRKGWFGRHPMALPVFFTICIFLWFTYNLLFRHHIRYSVVGLGGFRRLDRNIRKHKLPVEPQGRPAIIRIILPPQWMQQVFCRGDVITLTASKGHLSWHELDGSAEAVLPLSTTTLTAIWKDYVKPGWENDVKLISAIEQKPTRIKQKSNGDDIYFNLMYTRKIRCGSGDLLVTFSNGEVTK